jgi:hypothetical protein
MSRLLDANAFGRRILADIAVSHAKGEPVLVCQLANEALVGIGRLGTEPVMKMRDGQHQAEFALQFRKNAQQRHRICSPGYGDPKAIAREQEPPVPDVPQYPFAHASILHAQVILIRTLSTWSGTFSTLF